MRSFSIKPGLSMAWMGMALFLLFGVATASPQQPDVPTLSIAAHEVLLDVVVTDRSGHPVTGLTAADFHVIEEGEPQQLAHLEEHHPMSADQLAAEKFSHPLPANTFTNFIPIPNSNAQTVILLDALNTRLDTQMELREQLIDAIKHLPSGSPVAIFQMDSEMRLVQGFTTDMDVLLEAAKSKRNMPKLKNQIPGTREEVNLAHGETLQEGFATIGRYLAGFPGRKNLIWLTGSIPGSLLSDPTGNSFGRTFGDDMMLTGSDEHNLTDALTLSRVAVYPVNAHGLQTPPLYSAGNNSRGATSSIMRFESSQGAQRIAFNELAEATGGKAFFNSNGLKEVLAGIVGNGSSYYTLAYATTNKTWNSQFRHIKLLVDRPGVRLQNRQGYYAIDRQKQEQRLLASWQKHKNSHTSCCEEPGEQLTSSDETGALIKHPNGGLRQAMALGVVTPTEVIVKASLAMGDQVVKLEKNAPLPTDNYLDEDYRDKPFRTYSVQIQAGMRGLRLTQTPDGMRHDTVEFVTLVLDSTGGTVNSQMKKAVVDVNEELYQQLVASGLPMLQQIAVPVQGNFFLRIGVHDVNSGHIGTVEIPVDQIHPGVSGQGLLRP